MTHFAGSALTGGVAGDVSEVQQGGLLGTDHAGTFAAGSEGTAAYAETKTAVDDNPSSILSSATDNLPIGKIARAISASRAVIEIKADGYR